MPELPEVETTRRGLTPHIQGATIVDVQLHHSMLRWPIPTHLPTTLAHQKLCDIERRAKYLLFRFRHGTLLTHLGMSGSFRIAAPEIAYKKHDHVVITFNNEVQLRYHDPRRFGAMLWVEGDPFQHKLLATLGPEPLSDQFTAIHLMQHAAKRSITLKQLIMDGSVVVGVGNIYACEALFIAKFSPRRVANTLTHKEAQVLVKAIKDILQQAITKGGTTLRDFVNGDGKPGYFQQSLLVYGRAEQPCINCQTPLSQCKINARSTVFCECCQR